MRINKLICLALLCALCVGETWAQRGKRAMNRIDREVQETVFIPKGTWMAGGTVSYSEHDEGNLNFLVLKNVEGKGYNFGVSPYVGYFFRNNISAGMRFAYHRDYLDLKNFELNLGEDFNISLDNLYYLEHKYEVSGFLRTYMPIGRSKIFGLFNEARLTYGYGTGKNSTGTGATYDGSYQTAQNLRWIRFDTRPRDDGFYHRLVGRRGIGWRDGFRFQVDRPKDEPDRGGASACLLRQFQDQPLLDQHRHDLLSLMEKI